MMLLMWGFILLLAIAVIFLIALHFKNEAKMADETEQQHLEEKIALLEGNLKKTLEIMQELVKSVHHERETLSQAVQKVNHLETQQTELMALLAKYVGHAEDLKKTQPQQAGVSVQGAPES